MSWLNARRAADELLESVRRRALEATCGLPVGDAGYASTYRPSAKTDFFIFHFRYALNRRLPLGTVESLISSLSEFQIGGSEKS